MFVVLLPNVFHTNDMFALSEKSAEKKTKTGRLPIAHYKQKPAGSDLWPVNRCIPSLSPFLVLNIYHPPKHNSVFFLQFTEFLTLASAICPVVLLTGDLNIHNVDCANTVSFMDILELF